MPGHVREMADVPISRSRSGFRVVFQCVEMSLKIFQGMRLAQNWPVQDGGETPALGSALGRSALCREMVKPC
jgi:hypothetical protein